jgi:hypothetical protein
MRVPVVITEEVFTLVGDVLVDFGQEIERAEDLYWANRYKPGASFAARQELVFFRSPAGKLLTGTRWVLS